jgi:hypothetical protein
MNTGRLLAISLFLDAVRIVNPSTVYESLQDRIDRGERCLVLGRGPYEGGLLLNRSVQLRTSCPRKSSVGGSELRSGLENPTIQVGPIRLVFRTNFTILIIGARIGSMLSTSAESNPGGRRGEPLRTFYSTTLRIIACGYAPGSIQ